jgi:hypothetical protein
MARHISYFQEQYRLLIHAFHQEKRQAQSPHLHICSTFDRQYPLAKLGWPVHHERWDYSADLSCLVLHLPKMSVLSWPKDSLKICFLQLQLWFHRENWCDVAVSQNCHRRQTYRFLSNFDQLRQISKMKAHLPLYQHPFTPLLDF